MSAVLLQSHRTTVIAPCAAGFPLRAADPAALMRLAHELDLD